MQFSDKAIDELRRIYREEFQQEITPDQAAEIGTRLLDLVKLLRRPMPEWGDPRADPEH
jgi:hypothetical protein